ncbi:OmpH family outer membrane protein [Rhodobacter sp. NSM]|uniref:OmpH family outer membrane protein n=1 Tax=Rhodobacter sp. NSM TaxID=3457501 RepID=UPI003FD071A4
MHRLPALALALALALPGGVRAQIDAPAVPAGVAVIDQSRLITDTNLGRTVEQRFQVASRSLIAENREIEAALEAEERDLTARRGTMPAAEFRRLAAEFDTKVEGIRRAQEAKSRAVTRQRDEERQRIVEQALPILAGLMQERAALVLIDRGSVVLSRGAADITDAAIERLDALNPPPEPGADPADTGPADGPLPPAGAAPDAEPDAAPAADGPAAKAPDAASGADPADEAPQQPPATP